MGIDWESILDTNGSQLADVYERAVSDAMDQGRPRTAVGTYSYAYPLDDQSEDDVSRIDELDDRDGL